MREQRIIVEPFELLDIICCDGKVGGNFHGYMKIRGHIRADKENEYIGLLLKETWATVKVYDENDKTTVLFSGIITEGGIEAENGLKILECTIKTGSFLMDLEEHTRTFQKRSISFQKVLDTLTNGYSSGGCIMYTEKENQIQRFLCQYQETDWEFAKRLGSYCNAILFPNYVGYGVKVYFGLPEGNYQGSIGSNEYEIHQSQESIIYNVKLRELYNIGDTISFLGKIWYIVSRETKLEGGELYHKYEMSENQLSIQKPIYNDQLTGVSLLATVTSVGATSVQVSIKEDENKGTGGSRWFPFATVYSSLDGTGWYCMPEEKDQVRVYFPSNREDEAYVLHSVHIKSENPEERVHPEYKSFMNKQGKEILLRPDSILMTNNAGMSLELSDKDGISIVSDKTISIQSEEAIEITSVHDRVDLIAAESISLQQGDTQMKLADRLTLQGAKIRLD